jgi:hypothetical protein
MKLQLIEKYENKFVASDKYNRPKYFINYIILFLEP